MDAGPYYTLQFDVAACCYAVMVNDIPVLEDFEGGQCTVEIPLNQWIYAGSNQIRVILTPAADAETIPSAARFSAEVFVRQMGTERESRTLLGQLSYPNEDDSQITRATSLEISVSRPFSFDVPFEWQWQTSPRLDERPGLHEELLGKLKVIWAICEQKDVEALMPLFRERNRELSAAYFKSIEEREREFEKMLEQILSKEQLGFFREEGTRLRLFAEGRIARIDAQWHDSPLFFTDPGWTTATYFPVMFYQSPQGDLVPIR